ncbi:unnamed protein product, partial [Musa acuminata var. zebrina]
LPLTAFDLIWLKGGTVERVFFYRLPHSTAYFCASVLPHLKSSLSLALQQFYPLAGKIRRSPELDDDKYEIRYVDGDSVSFTVAEYDADFDEVSGDHARGVGPLLPLLPQLPRSDDDSVSVLALQVTVFPNQGVAVGVAVHHAGCDGSSSMRFMFSWASTCAGPRSSAAVVATPPVFDRSLVSAPSAGGVLRELRRRLLRRSEGRRTPTRKWGRLGCESYWQSHRKIRRRSFTRCRDMAGENHVYRASTTIKRGGITQVSGVRSGFWMGKAEEGQEPCLWRRAETKMVGWRSGWAWPSEWRCTTPDAMARAPCGSCSRGLPHARGREARRRRSWCRPSSTGVWFPCFGQRADCIIHEDPPVDMVIASFALKKDHIRRLKELVSAKAGAMEGGGASLRCSTIMATYAYVWVCLVKARAYESDRTAHFLFAADCRGRLRPPLPAAYFGNCIGVCFVEAKAGDLLRENGVVSAAKAIGKAIEEFADDPLRGAETWPERIKSIVPRQPLSVAGSPRFRVYDLDFGWGGPKKVVITSIMRSGAMSMAESREEEGGVEIGLVLPKH